MNSKAVLLNWARSCHFDGLIVVKEIKGKRWMNCLSRLEGQFGFDIDTMSQQEAWDKIKESIKKLTIDEANLYLSQRSRF